MVSGITTSAIFCRHCGYNLHGLPENRCAECGRSFDPNNRRSYAKSAGSYWRRRWARRIIVPLVAFIFLVGAGGFSLWWPWHREQAAVRMVHRCDGFAIAQPVGPQWLQDLLGERGGFLLMRVHFVNFQGDEFHKATDMDLAALDGLRELKWMNLCNTEMTDAGLEHLKDRQGLYALELGNTKVTDTGLEQLKNLKGLKELDLQGTKVTARGIAALKLALPGCDIYR